MTLTIADALFALAALLYFIRFYSASQRDITQLAPVLVCVGLILFS